MKMEDANMNKGNLEPLTMEEMSLVHGASAWDDWWYDLGYSLVDAFINQPSYSPTQEIVGNSNG